MVEGWIAGEGGAEAGSSGGVGNKRRQPCCRRHTTSPEWEESAMEWVGGVGGGTTISLHYGLRNDNLARWRTSTNLHGRLHILGGLVVWRVLCRVLGPSVVRRVGRWV
ncbi:hypothetical protein TIFTF001_005462 [Ficus carica]|uniref:Uncharacterized protein n=1 Tax=Ficus carica TaxID=3494 RepID=A0AA87ZG71_FICCA|nr:hypothetical protein TIFTF001_005462 [Ficus carica]